MNILITGSNGFIGSALMKDLNERGHNVCGVIRNTREPLSTDSYIALKEYLSPSTDWRVVLKNRDAVIHTAGRVHVMRDTALDPLGEYRRLNVEGTMNLARQAADMGVHRFIFLSSIKVNGEFSVPGEPFTADDIPAPIDPYAISKMEAEKGLLKIAEEKGIEVVIIRPPIVYGPGVKANFTKMMRWLYLGIPLPLGSIKNLRSMVSIDNLIDFISVCMEHHNARNKVFLVSDGEDLSITNLLERLGQALGKKAHLFPVPEAWLTACATLIGKGPFIKRLCGSLQVDISKAREILDWIPSVSINTALMKTAKDFLRIIHNIENS